MARWWVWSYFQELFAVASIPVRHYFYDHLSTPLLSLFGFLGKLNWNCKNLFFFFNSTFSVRDLMESEWSMSNEFHKTFQESCVKCPSSGRFYHVFLTSTNKAWFKGFGWFRVHMSSVLLSSFLYIVIPLSWFIGISLRMVWDEMVAEGVLSPKNNSGMLPAT